MYSTVSGPMHPPLAFGYCRKSTTGQREESIEAQQRAIVAYAAAMGYQLVHIYKDHGNSGRSGERPEFQQMLQDAVPAGVQFIIVHKLDRFFRNAERQTLIEAQLRRQGIRVLSASEHFDDTPQGQFMRNITKAINQWYSANLATEVMKGMRENAMGARNTGGPPPLGYAVDKTTGKFVLQPTEAAAVQMIFRMYRQGCGYTEIIDALNAAGHVTRRGRPFGKNSLYDILRNEKYTGTYVWNRLAPADPDGRTNRRNLKPRSEWVCVEGGMPQIITPEEFKEVQAEMNNRKHRSAAYTAKAFYLLSGLVYCGGCGGSMSGESHRYKSHGKPVEYRYYTCSAKKRLHADGEHARPVPAASLEGAVVDYLQRVIFNPANMDTLCAALLQSMEPDPRHTDLAADLKRQAAEVQLKIDRIYAAIEKGLDPSSAIERINTLQQQRLALLAQATDLDMTDDVAKINIDQLREVWSRIQLKDMEPVQLRAVIREMVHKIIVFDDGPGGFRVRIILNPGHVAPANIPENVETASLSELQDFSTNGGRGLPLPKTAYRKVRGFLFVQGNTAQLPSAAPSAAPHHLRCKKAR